MNTNLSGIYGWQINPYLVKDKALLNIPLEIHDLDDVCYRILEAPTTPELAQNPYNALAGPMAAAYFCYQTGWGEGDIFDIWEKFYEDLLPYLNERNDTPEHQETFDLWESMKDKSLTSCSWKIEGGILELSMFIGDGSEEEDTPSKPKEDYSRYTPITPDQYLMESDSTYAWCREYDLENILK